MEKKNLQQLNQELAQIDEQREIILDKLSDEYEIEKLKEFGKYSHMIGKCFVSNFDENKSHKIISILKIYQNGEMGINVVICESNSIYKFDMNYVPEYVTEISLEQFESNLNQTFNNISKL